MEDSWRNAAKVVVGVLVAGSLLVGCGVFAFLNAFSWDPPANAEAKRREQILVQLQPRDLRLGPLIYSGSDAGKRAGEGDFQLGDDVSATRRYSFSGEPTATCAAVVANLVADGWRETGPHKGCGYAQTATAVKGPGLREYRFVDLAFDCITFQAHATLTLLMERENDPPQELTVRLETRYPESESQPPGNPNPRCVLKGPGT